MLQLRSHHQSCEIIIKNIAYEKKVSIWKGKDGPWEDDFAEFRDMLPDGMEKWIIDRPAKNIEFNFNAKYVVNGNAYCDNNNWKNYSIKDDTDDFNAVTGSWFPIVLGDARLTRHRFTSFAGVQNLACEKTVGLVYSIDGWKDYRNIYAKYLRTLKSGLEVWKFELDIHHVSSIDFALFYKVNGCEYWDNNFRRNYTVTLKDNNKRSCWDLPEIIDHKTKRPEFKEKEPELEPA
jgi:hypothetical protein